VHLVHLDHLNAGRRADGLDRLAVRPDPVVHGDMAAFQEPSNRAETQAFKVQLQGIPLGRCGYAALLDGVPVPARLALMPLLAFDYAIFTAICRTTFGTIHSIFAPL
jgi:hypothetical protein